MVGDLDMDHLGIYFFSVGRVGGKDSSMELRFLVASTITRLASRSVTFYASAA